jgi:putative ABC transport system permease protein
VVSQSFAKKYWPQASAIGQRFRVRRPKGWGPWWQVGGVVSDVAGRGPRDQKDEVYIPYGSGASAAATIVARVRHNAEGLSQGLKSQVWEVDPGVPVTDVLTVRAALARSYDEQPFYAVLFGLFAGIALALSAAGVFGMTAYATSRRRREVGIRIALGAHATDVERLIVRQGVVPPLVGVAAGSIAALVLTRFVESFLYGLTAADPTVYVGSAVTLLAVSLLATWIPARRASRVDPIIALRAD